jgi:hypothetical protein
MAKIGGTGMYAIPSQTSAKFPEEYLERTLAEIRIGEHVVVQASALVVDNDLDCWLRPDIIVGSDAVALSSSDPCVTVIREERGYVVSLHSSRGHRWRRGHKPEPLNGREWIHVVELKY